MELTAGLWSQQRAATSPRTMCPRSHCCPPPSLWGSVPAHPGAFSRLTHPSSSPVLCPVSYTLEVFHIHWTMVGSVSGVLVPLAGVPLAGVFAFDPFYSATLQHPLARSPQFSSTLCQTVMPRQCTHRSMIQGYPDASISPAYPVAPSSLALVFVPLVWFRMLGRERGSRRCADGT